MKTLQRTLMAAALLAAVGAATAVPVTLTALTGITGGPTAPATGVYKGDLSALGLSILSISIRDNSTGLGGAGGQFSGFDLDAIKLSTTECFDAACVSSLVGLSVFDFINGVNFTPGAQRTPADPKLFGTNAAGTGVDNSVATLGFFDGEATTAIPGAAGFLSMGDDGLISFNLTSAVSSAGLFLYIGEVGDNGEVAASNIEVRDVPTGIPEPSSLALVGLALFGAAALRRAK